MPHALVSGTKSMTGHSFGAVGATEGIMCALAIKNEVVPPTINLENLAEDCEQLNYVGGESQEAPRTSSGHLELDGLRRAQRRGSILEGVE